MPAPHRALGRALHRAWKWGVGLDFAVQMIVGVSLLAAGGAFAAPLLTSQSTPAQIVGMADSTGCVTNPGVTVGALYLVGHGQTHAATSSEWACERARFERLLPIYVAYTSFSTPTADADSAAAQTAGLGLARGTAVALDIESNVASRAVAYVPAWSDQLRRDGFVPLIYTSRSTSSVVHGELDWIAGYDGSASLEGHAAHQWTDQGCGGGGCDLSVIDLARVPVAPSNGAALSTFPPPAQAVPVQPAQSTSSSARLSQPAVALVSPRQGYYLVAADGGVFAFGGAPFYGSAGNQTLTSPVVAAAVTPDGGGYWLAAADGGVFAYGDASFYGSMGGTPLASPVVAIASTSDGHGYRLAGRDGGIFCFGDATFAGSAG